MQARYVVAAQLALLLVLGVVTAERWPIWALVDERAHTAFVASVADDQRLPFLGRDKVPAPLLMLDDGPVTGLARESYEAFQPPLYYVVAAPVYAVSNEPRMQVRLLRLFDLALLGLAVWLLWLLAGRVAASAGGGVGGNNLRFGLFAGGLVFLLLPGVLVREVTVSNAALEPAVALAAILAMWDRRLLLAGLFVGLALLTRLNMLALMPLLAWVAWSGWRAGAPAWRAGLAVLLPVLCLAPWLVSNVDRYDGLTAGEIVRDMQEPLLNPTGERFGVSFLDEGHARLLNGLLPEEWWSQWLDTGKRRLRDLAILLLLGVPLVLAAFRPPARGWSSAALLAGPLILGILLMSVGTLVGNWDFFFPRYLTAFVAPFGMFAALALRRYGGERTVTWTAAGLTVVLAGVWAALATVTPYSP